MQKNNEARRTYLLLIFLFVFFGIAFFLPNSVNATVIPDNYMEIFNKGVDRLDPENIEGHGSGCVVTGPNNSKITWIGDSISVGAKTQIQSTFSLVDLYAQTGKQFGSSSDVASAQDPAINSINSSTPTGVSILKWLAQNNKLNDYIVFALGTNSSSSVSSSSIQAALSAIGGNSKLILVTNYKLETTNSFDSNNTAMKNAANEQIIVADWYTVAESNQTSTDGLSNSFISDDGYGVHLTIEGEKAFANTIYNALSSIWTIPDASSNPAGIDENDEDYVFIRNNTNAKIIFQYFRNQGLDAIHAAAIVGNMYQEHSFQTHNVEEYQCGEYMCGGLGITQWIGGRRDGVFAYASSQGRSYEDLNLQLEYNWAEMTGQGPAANYASIQYDHNAFLNISSLEEAVWFYNNKFERSADTKEGANNQRRVKAARIVLHLWGEVSSC